jgi:hypothetical protein
MPYKIRKIKSRKIKGRKIKSRSYKVVNSKTGKVYSKSTTLKKAKAQVKFLGMIESRKNKGGNYPNTPNNSNNPNNFNNNDIPEGVIDVNDINNNNNNNNVNLYAPFADEQHVLDFIQNDEFEDYFNTIDELEEDIIILQGTIAVRQERGLDNTNMYAALDKLNDFLNQAQTQGGKKRMNKRMNKRIKKNK